MTISDEARREAMFIHKAFEYVADPGFGATVVQYLRTNIEEYAAQIKASPYPTAAQYAQGKHDAYVDALRVLDGAIESALDYANKNSTCRFHPEDDDDEQPSYGTQTTCEHCDLDVEWHGDQWLDRGGNSTCPISVGEREHGHEGRMS